MPYPAYSAYGTPEAVREAQRARLVVSGGRSCLKYWSRRVSSIKQEQGCAVSRLCLHLVGCGATAQKDETV